MTMKTLCAVVLLLALNVSADARSAASATPLSHELFVEKALGELCRGPGDNPFNMQACDENLIQAEVLKKRGCSPPTERWGKWTCK